MADDKMKGDQDFKNHSNNSTTSPLQAKPASGLVSNPFQTGKIFFIISGLDVILFEYCI